MRAGQLVKAVLVAAIAAILVAVGHTSAIAEDGIGDEQNIPDTNRQATTAVSGEKVDQCYGHRVRKDRMKIIPNKKVGRVELWYSSRSGGTSCVMAYHGRGGPTSSVAYIQRTTKPVSSVRQDRGVYRYYAGGVLIKKMNGECLGWGGTAGGHKRPLATFHAPHAVHPKTGKAC